jgi:hypothetical protein
VCFDFGWNSSLSKKSSARYYHIFIQVCRWSTRYACQILIKFEFWPHIFFFPKNRRASNFIKIRSVEADLFPCGQTKITVAFRNFANSPKIIALAKPRVHSLTSHLTESPCRYSYLRSTWPPPDMQLQQLRSHNLIPEAFVTSHGSWDVTSDNGCLLAITCNNVGTRVLATNDKAHAGVGKTLCHVLPCRNKPHRFDFCSSFSC